MSRIAALCALALPLFAQLGYKDTPIIPGQPWHVHDPDRPHPPMVAPGAQPGDALLRCHRPLRRQRSLALGAARSKGASVDAKWKVENGYFEVAPGSGDMFTRDQFGDAQIHIEWSEPTTVRGQSQDRGNSGVYIQGLYEIQVLDSFHNPTYADGQAGGIYGQWPPMVNPIRKPGEWNVYDIVFEAPKFEGDKLTKPAFVTLFFNGVAVHNRKELNGSTEHRILGSYKPHGDGPILLQDHGHPVRYRNIWVRRMAGYDQPEK